ncbi:hypothetical protein N7495_005631 [Penicillium taxi]|uniref:uncharacterized protein n=1 Tax=Penicillium taxi TaxID=168475 RepID=UPI002544FF01|nr:uncharacterized protein N7495_005631 [Penicillium taxi]KAJ5893940.1 hypothetical protein N7495_005631 [Penicillium taxi]
MTTSRTNIVSILNDDDHPSFAVRSNQRISRTVFSGQAELHSSLQSQYIRPSISTASESPTASPRVTRNPFDPVPEAVHSTSPGSSEGSTYDYIMSQPSASAYHPYARHDLRRDPFRYSSRGPPAPQTPPEMDPITTDMKSNQAARGLGRKNKYPCPYSASHGCTATFTTSGHAARHGKKHTGEKSVHCPICNKAFTRKDNMKQHIRTHRTHSDEIRSTSVSEPEAESRWTVARPDSGYALATNERPMKYTVDASTQSSPRAGSSRPS